MTSTTNNHKFLGIKDDFETLAFYLQKLLLTERIIIKNIDYQDIELLARIIEADEDFAAKLLLQKEFDEENEINEAILQEQNRELEAIDTMRRQLDNLEMEIEADLFDEEEERYERPARRPEVAPKQSRPYKNQDTCKYGIDCTRKGCTFFHQDNCASWGECSKKDCQLRHPQKCQYGSKCRNKGCLYGHC